MAIADELAKKQREIGVAEFFAKNRHLLGFDNKRKALLTTIKEAVDNSLDACEEARILPEVSIEVVQMAEERFRVIVEDNGPGIVKAQIPKVFAKLLYGSKFHKLSQSLTGDQPVLIQKDKETKIELIGELIDQYIPEEGIKDVSDLNITVPAFDWKNYQYSFQPVSHLIKHKQQNEIYEITLHSGRKIKVTGCHSLFSLNSELKVEAVEARKLAIGDYLLVPKKIPEPEIKNEICLLDYLKPEEVKDQWWYLYGLERSKIVSLFSKAEIVHKKTGKSRKFYRFVSKDKTLDILDDSYKQYLEKGFLPLSVALELNVIPPEQSYIQTYLHGKKTKVPVFWAITPSFMRFLGLFVAEGHVDKRQIGFTFGSHEKELIKEIAEFALMHGLNHTLEHRPEKNSLRLKIFSGVISNLLEKWCNRGAKNKKIPDFVFSADFENRQHFLDALYQGDGHNAKKRNQLMHTTVSHTLANQLLYLWMMQGVIAHQTKKLEKGLGKNYSTVYVTNIYGGDINKSLVYTGFAKIKTNFHSFLPKKYFQEFCPKKMISSADCIFSSIGLSEKHLKVLEQSKFVSNKKIIQENSDSNQHTFNHLIKTGFIESSGDQILLSEKYGQLNQKIFAMSRFFNSDLCLLKIKSIEKLSLKDQWVYDFSVPNMENFVGGFGGISAHNSRGQQGIGISASVMYGQLTTGRPARILSKIDKNHPAHYYELKIDTEKNSPVIVKEEVKEWEKEHGTKVEIDLEAIYQAGSKSIDEYLKQTAIVNPYATIIYTNQKAEQVIFARGVDKLPPAAKEIKPHPYGVELGNLMNMLASTDSRTLQSFLTSDFSRVGPGTAKEICENAALLPNTKPESLSMDMAEKLLEGIKKTKIIAPPTDCLSPISEEELEKGLKKEINAEFYCSVSRAPEVYRGNPFIVEVGIAYGGKQAPEESCNLLRFANKVPLLYQQSACASVKAVMQTAWKNYGLQQSNGSIPVGPCTILVHIASVWVPFTSESKEAIAHYPEIIKEMKLALQECGRKLASYVRKKNRIGEESLKRSYIEKYIPHVAAALRELLGLKQADEIKMQENLKELLEKTRGKLDNMSVDNPYYDKDLAAIGGEGEDESEEIKKDEN